MVECEKVRTLTQTGVENPSGRVVVKGGQVVAIVEVK